MAALMLASCDKAEEITVDDGSIRFVMQHPSATRATETSFEQGDKIGLYLTEYTGETPAPLQISGNWANNVAATLDGADWVTAKKIFWSDNRMDVYGYYPYMSPVSIDEQPFSVSLDQSAERVGDRLGGYEASDFLWAKTEGVDQSEQTVTLQFSHRCSKLVIKLVKGSSYEGELPDNATSTSIASCRQQPSILRQEPSRRISSARWQRSKPERLTMRLMKPLSFRSVLSRAVPLSRLSSTTCLTCWKIRSSSRPACSIRCR